MSRLDDLPPDQRAALSLLLRQDKSYADVAALLSIDRRAVHDRAHAALAVLAPREARRLSAERREEVGDYLLGQRASVAERLATRTYLEGSPAARSWGTALAAELEPLAGGSLPEIPGGVEPKAAAALPRAANEGPSPRAPSPSPSPSTPPSTPLVSSRPADDSSARATLPSSRVGGGLLLAALIAVVIAAVVLITGSGGGGGGSHNATTAAVSDATPATATSATGTTSTAAKAKEDKRITLTSPNPASKAVGVAEVLSEGAKHAFYLAAEHLPPSKGQGFFYAIWLYNSPSSHEAVSKAPAVGSDGRMQGGALLPEDAGKFGRMLVTKETSSRPTSPGPTVLSGAFALH